MSIFVELPRNAYPDNALDGFTATREFKLDNARAMMWLSQLAYETAHQDKVDDILKAWRLTKLTLITNNALTGLPPHSACVVVAEGHEATFVTFSGSDPAKPEDWITDFEAMPSPDDLHSGFAKAVETVWPAIQTALANRTAPTQPVFFTGHSLGGALAILAAFLAASREPLKRDLEQIVVYTFGSPRNGGAKFFSDYPPRLGDATFRFIHGTDIVPTVPFTLLHVYRHVGQAAQCGSGAAFEGVLPTARDGDKPMILESAAQAGLADFGALTALQFVHGIGPGLRNELAGVLPRMVRDHVPQSYFRALSIDVPAFGLFD
jgi:triacylglycerol lipase